MSLWDVDKDGDKRDKPTLNQNDRVAQRKANQTLSTTYQTSDTPTPNTKISFKHNMILYYDDQNRIIKVDGFIPSLANYPVSITAVYGYDVFTDILGIAAPGS